MYSNFYFQGFRLNSYSETLPENLPFFRIHSLEIYQEPTAANIIRKCLALRSLKLIGDSEWIISLLRQISSDNIQFERFMLVSSGLAPLEIVLTLAESMSSLRQFGICIDEIEKNIQLNHLHCIHPHQLVGMIW